MSPPPLHPSLYPAPPKYRPFLDLEVEEILEYKDEFPIWSINAGGTGNINIPTSGTAELAANLITVPPSPHEDVWLEASMIYQQTALGVGQMFLYIYEGLSTQITSFVAQLPNNTGGQKYGQVWGKYNLGRTTVHREFTLRASATFACQALGTLFNPTIFGAYL